MNRIYPCPIHGEGNDRRAWGDVKRHACGCPVLAGELEILGTCGCGKPLTEDNISENGDMCEKCDELQY